MGWLFAVCACFAVKFLGVIQRMNWREIMKKALVVITVLALVFTSTPAFAGGDKELYIPADILIIRPISIAFLPVSVALFVVSLPFALLGGNVQETAKVLVENPARFAFVRG